MSLPGIPGSKDSGGGIQNLLKPPDPLELLKNPLKPLEDLLKLLGLGGQEGQKPGGGAPAGASSGAPAGGGGASQAGSMDPDALQRLIEKLKEAMDPANGGPQNLEAFLNQFPPEQRGAIKQQLAGLVAAAGGAGGAGIGAIGGGGRGRA